ncbi:MAG: ribonuclease HIII [Pigeon pea little leaf phytoplasma]|uniref:Ribonuclease n=1 Tax=Candidatus Phytoplasma fabacearum TaxID=2982628 RepID=A0ABU8ZS58_9MOLU|nr:ribonuclease HIII ['Bituminaria bituminosa' little leaf phytoplasma]MDV3148840.1 ribonuclease HIII [Pigeon pea little leaf phytoplasma]MDO7983453.1 ribonuclease HIII ['Bituminaria bituminosa' little leaf phytoplasma]MDO8023770.1 ribonuclease HIII ['Bituminaria bituminosa' little leaf phytoplasma]MDO8030411.1 ribonuclease HIII ['Bituminaria bituminosa' little leaf phytoplasma]MDV3153983.1 ribonuclease HIII [Pigeon pea little leaf phytoplasma]
MKKNFQNYIGCVGADESGKGDVFGPIVVSIVYIRYELEDFLLRNRVKDSKLLSKNSIFQIAPFLMKNIDYDFEILQPFDYNNLIKKKLNLNHILACLYNKLILRFYHNLKFSSPVIIDQFATESFYFNYLKTESNVYRHIRFQTKAESKFLCVAASSIIARYLFLREIEKLGQLNNVKLILGASDLVNRQIKLIYEKYGLSIFYKIAKINFKNISKNTCFN